MAFIRDRLFPGGLGNVARAFTHRNYRVYAGGNAVSLIGVWMQRVAVGWLTWTLTHSGTWLGLVSLAGGIVMYLTATATSGPSTAHVEAVPLVGPQLAGLGVRGAW